MAPVIPGASAQPATEEERKTQKAPHYCHQWCWAAQDGAACGLHPTWSVSTTTVGSILQTEHNAAQLPYNKGVAAD
jgi:hypothetical protein